MLGRTAEIGQNQSLKCSYMSMGRRMSEHGHTSNLQVSVTADEVIVLFEFLSRFEESDELTIVDQAEERTLSNLLGLFQKQLVSPFQRDYLGQLKQARNRLRDNVA